MSLMQATSNVFKNYANFNGRARRSEYWYFYLFNVLVSIAVWILGAIITAISQAAAGLFITPAILFLYSLATIIPNLAVTCRRLHDVGKSGAYMFFFLLPFVGAILVWVWSFQDGQPWTNQYGEDPKGRNMSYGVTGGVPASNPHMVGKVNKICPHCKREIDADSVFCSYCGKNTHEKKVKTEPGEAGGAVMHKKSCVNCGAMIDRSAKFCPHCGCNADDGTHHKNAGSKPAGGFSAPTDLG